MGNSNRQIRRPCADAANEFIRLITWINSFLAFSFFFIFLWQRFCNWMYMKRKEKKQQQRQNQDQHLFFQLTKSYWYFDGCKVGLMLGVRVLALFFLTITINFYKHISKLFWWTMRYRKQSVDRSKSFKTLKGAPGRRFKSDASKAF